MKYCDDYEEDEEEEEDQNYDEEHEKDSEENEYDKFIKKVTKQKSFKEIFDFYRDLLGFKYPYKSYKQILLQDTNFLCCDSDLNNSLLSFCTFTIIK